MKVHTGVIPKQNSVWLFGIAVLLSCAAWPIPAESQVAGAVERAAARAAARQAQRNAMKRSAAQAERASASKATQREAADVLVRRWNPAICNRRNPCPLPPQFTNGFSGGGSYNEVRLGRDTTFYRVYSDPKRAYGVPGEKFAYYSRSDAKGTRAIIDSALPVLKTGNLAEKQVSITVPKGSRVFEGYTGSLNRSRDRGTSVGGGSQVVIELSVLRKAGVDF